MKCRLCGSARLTLLYSQGNRDEFRFWRCGVCRLVNGDLSAGLDQDKYARAYIDPFDETHPVNRAQAITYAYIRRRIARRGRLLEIGCGNGKLLQLAAHDGWDAQGLELSPFLAQSVRERLGIEVETADFCAYRPADGRRFDLVLLRHVLEHLPDSIGALRAIRALLNDGGLALLEFPNIDALDLRVKRGLRKAGLHRRRYPADYRPGHCNEFCRASFESLLRQTGFALTDWSTYSYRPLSNWIFQRWPVGNKARAVIRKQAA